MELFENYRMYARHTLLLSRSSHEPMRVATPTEQKAQHTMTFRSFQLDYDRGYQHASDDLSGR